MAPLEELPKHLIKIIFCDIDDTLSSDGQLHAEPYDALWKLSSQGYTIVPVTGRPAGWCEMIARFWPVHGVIGENGGFYFRYDRDAKKMQRHFYFDKETQIQNRIRLDGVRKKVLAEVPEAGIASDQFCRLMDLAIDFCEDVPALSTVQVERIQKIFEENGAKAKISSIHINGWYGDYDKVSMTETYLKSELGIDWKDKNENCLFVGDSPNDEPMFAAFENSVGVANVLEFANQMTEKPKFITEKKSGQGFVQLAKKLLQD